MFDLKDKEIIITFLLIIDLIIIFYMILVEVSFNLILFDTIISIIMLLDIFFEIKNSKNKKKSLKNNIIQIIASIPYDLILLGSGLSILKFLRIFKIIKLLKVVSFIKLFIKKIERINDNIHFDRIIIVILIILVFCGISIYLFEGLNLLDSIYFVVITFSSVGFGDIIMKTSIGRAIAIIISLTSIIGISAFSALVINYFNMENDSNISNLKKEVEELKKQNEMIIELLKNKEKNK